MGVARSQRLRAFVEALADVPVVWGQSDCSAAPARWAEREFGVALALPDYRSREEAHRLIAAAGGLAELWSSIAIPAGMVERFGEPEIGDIGVVDTRLYGHIGGIWGAGRVLIVRKDDGGWHPLGPVRRYVKAFTGP